MVQVHVNDLEAFALEQDQQQQQQHDSTVDEEVSPPARALARGDSYYLHANMHEEEDHMTCVSSVTGLHDADLYPASGNMYPVLTAIATEGQASSKELDLSAGCAMSPALSAVKEEVDTITLASTTSGTGGGDTTNTQTISIRSAGTTLPVTAKRELHEKEASILKTAAAQRKLGHREVSPPTTTREIGNDVINIKCATTMHLRSQNGADSSGDLHLLGLQQKEYDQMLTGQQQNETQSVAQKEDTPDELQNKAEFPAPVAATTKTTKSQLQQGSDRQEEMDPTTTIDASLDSIQPLPLSVPIAAAATTTTRNQSIPGAFEVVSRAGLGPSTTTPLESPQGPTAGDQHHYDGQEEKTNNSDGSMAIAVPVDDDNDDGAPRQIARPDKSTTCTQEKRFISAAAAGKLLTCLFLIVVAVISSICGAGICSSGSDDDIISETPLSTASRYIYMSDIRSTLESVFGEDYFPTTYGSTSTEVELEPDHPRTRALNWIVAEDPLALDPQAGNLLQRFILALMYFQTSQQSHWKWCGPPPRGADDDDDDANTCKIFIQRDTVWTTRWLSGTHECLWAGIMCEDGRGVSKLELVDFGLNGLLPAEISELSAVYILNLNSNLLIGTISERFGNLHALRFLLLQDNRLTGNIPTEIFRVQFRVLTVAKNLLTGTLPTEAGILMEEH